LLRGSGGGEPRGAELLQAPKYNVIFRTCDAVQALRGSRSFGLDKRTLIKACFLSLHDSLEDFPHSIHILGDKLSPELARFFQRFAERDRRVTLSQGDWGNDESIRQSITRAVSFPEDEWVFFCEDDYLHRPIAFAWIDELIRSRAQTLRFEPGRWFMKMLFRRANEAPLFIHPADYPDRYEAAKRQFSLVFITRLNHWRQISSTTFTFLGEVRSIKRFEKYIRESSVGARDDYLSRHLYSHVFFFGRGLCLSPIPGVSTHMTDGVMSPIVDWESLLRDTLSRVERLEG
jgi:hypothetical protein